LNNQNITTSPKSVTKYNQRTKILINISITIFLILLVVISYLILPQENLSSNMSMINQSPSLEYPFGTDWLGRDMLTRTVHGLMISLLVGTITSIMTITIGIILGILSSLHPTLDSIVSWFINLSLTIPSMIFIILISVILGRGLVGVIVGISLTHWASFARLIRAEVVEIKDSEYVKISRKLGKTSWWIAKHHILPHLIPLTSVGFTLSFPQAILHEASITLLGFGLPPHEPAIGIILSESIQYLSNGSWWLMFFPGLCLLLIVLSIQKTGENLRQLIDPETIHE